MTTIRITATPEQVIGWLDHAAKSSARAITASKLEKIKSAHREELDWIERTMRELRQTDLEDHIPAKPAHEPGGTVTDLKPKK